MAAERATSANLQKTLALIKPDAVRAGKALEIEQLIELQGFTVIQKQSLTLTKTRAMEFYAEHKGRPFYDTLTNFISGGPIVALCLAKVDAIVGWRAMMGPTNSFKARDENPTCLRALYGTDGTQNATHGSDSPASAAREIKFFFPKLVLEVPSPEAAKEYVARFLQPTLLKGLTALCKEKPSADKLQAITWLAEWLLDNNPNKPRIVPKAEYPINEEDEDDEVEFSAGTVLEEIRREGPTAEDVDILEQEQAATRLQSHFRGYQTRKDMRKANRAKVAAPVVVVGESTGADQGQSLAETFAEDPEMDKAATKLQSSFRGHMARKEVDAKKAEAKASAETAEQEAAALRIQSIQRGRKARKDVSAKRAEKAAAALADAEEAPAETA
ncbi:hypothetical protein PPROV_000911600 [Pycnococcus provasolii]|uniref:Nucleoside diphosphate kinase-like domain-containing protein n=1 Tax=Pycnococcus provasolii TaxID=41880 RepID=A0A830HUK9_9CHLO|nr:hypothetical protein PPROV_000911600 [Pycnococcus provasolii]